MAREKGIPVLNTHDISSFSMHSIKWLPHTSSSQQNEFHVNRLIDITDKKNFKVLPHRKTYHDFFFLKKGMAIRSKGLSSYTMTGPAIFFLPAYQITEHQMLSEDAEGFYCYFSEKVFDMFPKVLLNERYLFFQYQTNPVIQLPKETLESLENILERLYLLYQQKEFNKALVSLSLMTIFEEVKAIATETISKNRKSNYQITKRYKIALAKYIYEFQSITDYANLLNVTPNYLNKCIKTSIGKTAQDLLKEMLILEAKTLIRHSDLNISEIAAKLCNQTPSNFARFFKNQTGVSPKEYAQQN